MIGEYQFAWTITTPIGQCKNSDTVTFNVICALPVSLTRFTATKKSDVVQLEWTTVSNNYVTIDGLDGGELIRVNNVMGRLLKEFKSHASSAVLQLDEWNEGVYYILIFNANGTMVSKKIMKSN
jgi:hypothetical protein